MTRIRFLALPLLLTSISTLVPTGVARASTYTVNETADELDGSCSDGDCSLRDAIVAANSHAGADTIAFALPACPPACVISPTSALPLMSGGDTTIDGYTQSGASPAEGDGEATLMVVLDGSLAGALANGLVLSSPRNVVRGLVIARFAVNGIAIVGETATSNDVAGNYVGTDASGMLDRGNALDGVFIGQAASKNTVGGNEPAARNVISGNDWEGVAIHGAGTYGNFVSGNYIGTDDAGTGDLGNTLHGVRVYGGSHDNVIGGNSAAERNIISANDEDGVRIAGAGTNGNVVSRNCIGITSDGLAALGNAKSGVSILLGAQENTIGGDGAEDRNVISGNAESGVSIEDTGTATNVVSGNYIGTDARGLVALGNGNDGVAIRAGAQANIVGGSVAGTSNVISGNHDEGVVIADEETDENVVQGNIIGLDADGVSVLGNGENGVEILNGPDNTVIGGSTTNERNVISGNAGFGVALAAISHDVTGTTVVGNYIGTDVAGTVALGNGYDGVSLLGNAVDNVIGGQTPADRNVISGNGRHGVTLNANVFGPGADNTGNFVSGNYIGIDASGVAPLGNTFHGVVIEDGARANNVGGPTSGAGNIISGNGNYGVGIWGAGTEYNVVVHNLIGTGAADGGEAGNGGAGVVIGDGARYNTVAIDRISHNGGDGVLVTGSGTSGNGIRANRIVDNALGINLESGANAGMLPPNILSAHPTGAPSPSCPDCILVQGAACPGCTVEIFYSSTADGEGEFYGGWAIAEPAGPFAVELHAEYPYLTATATDAGDGTSEFSIVFVATLPATPTGTATRTGTPTSTVTRTATRTATRTRTQTASTTATASPTPSLSATATCTPSPTRTTTSTATSTPSFTTTATATTTPTQSRTPSATGTATRTVTPEATSTATRTARPTDTSTLAPTVTTTSTLTPTSTPMATPTATWSYTPTETVLPTASVTTTRSPTFSTTRTPVPTETPPWTPAVTPTTTASLPTESPTAKPEASPSPSPSATLTPTPTDGITLTATATPTATTAHTPVPRCAGDCDGSDTVTVDELVAGVNIALGLRALDDCPAFDRNGSGTVTVEELVQAVQAALSGCDE